MQTPQTLNITVGTDVILNVYLEHDGDTITPSLIDDLQANLITGLGRKTPLEATISADFVVVSIPWVDGRLPGCYSLEITGSINNLAWSAVGKSIIRYTSATEIGRSTVEVTGDTYDVTMEVGYYYTDSPIGNVTVSVDDQVGEPYVVTSYVKKELNMAFHNMKGETGGIGPVGPQGIPGTGAIWTGQGEKIMQLEQTHGTAINKAMSQAALTDELIAEWVYMKETPYALNYYIGGNSSPQTWKTGSAGANTCKIIPVTPGEVFKFLKNGDNSYHVVFLTTDEINVGQVPSYYDGSTTDVQWIDVDKVIVVPHGASYMYYREYSGEVDKSPRIFEGILVKGKTSELSQDSPVDGEWDSTLIDLSTFETSRFVINKSGVWVEGSNSDNLSKTIGITPGSRYAIVSDSEASHHVVFLQDTTRVKNNRPHYAGDDCVYGWVFGTEVITAPEDAYYMYIRTKSSGNNVEPDIYAIGTIGDKIIDVDKVSDSDVKCFHHNDYILKYISNGLWASASNYNNSCKLIPVMPGATYKFAVRKGTGSYHAFFLKDDYSEPGYPPHYVDGIDDMPGWISVSQTLVAPSDAKYLYVRYMTSGADRSPYITEYVSGDELHSDISDERAVVRQAAKVYPDDDSTPEVPSLRLIHFSDIHGDEGAANALLDYMRIYKGVLDDSIVSGDVVHYHYASSAQYPNGAAWWQGCGLAEKSLFVLGNHDGRVGTSTDGKGQAVDYDTYIAPYAEGLGIIRPEGYDNPESPYYKACYWHKDYAGAKIRLIGIDAIHRFDGILDPNTGDILVAGLFYNFTEQEKWLIDRLNETLAGSGDSAEGYSVIVCGHYPLDDFDDTDRENMRWDDTTHKWVCNEQSYGGIVTNGKTASQTNWHYGITRNMVQKKEYNMRNRVGTTSSWTMGDVNNIGDILNTFIGNGGKFVAWLCGHFHQDFFYYPQAYPNILNIAINQAGYLRGGSEADKNVGAPRLSANMVAVDAHRGLLKIARLGQKVTRLMVPMNAICYDYINKKVISEW